MPSNDFTVFGIPLTSGQQKDIDKQSETGKSFIGPTGLDGSVEIEVDENQQSAAYNAGGVFHHQLSFGLSYKDEAELINKYRKMSLTADIDSAIDEIVNEVMSFDAEEPPIEIITDDLKLSSSIRTKISKEFDEILRLTRFNMRGDDLFRRWYIDGRLFHHLIVDENKAKEGIQEIRYVDPRKIKKVREIIKKKDPNSGLEVIVGTKEYFVFKENKKKEYTSSDLAVQIPAEAIVYTHSGIIDEDSDENTIVLSYLHKALKPWNLTNMVEDAQVIYKISRAPERRLFYIDVGNLPKTQAEQYMNGIINKYKNKLVYDSSTGTVKDSVHTMSMMEDIWLPRREGSRGTEVSTLQGGGGLGEVEEIEYFMKKLYRSLHIPLSRIEAAGETQFSMGSTEITRDELKFSKFVSKLRKRFSSMFTDMLKVQLLLKNIITVEDWDLIEENIRYRFNLDLHFQEMKEAEIFNKQLEQLDAVDGYVGRYFSIEYVQKKILKQSDEDIKEIKKQKDAEKAANDMPKDAGYEPGQPSEYDFEGEKREAEGVEPEGEEEPPPDEEQTDNENDE